MNERERLIELLKNNQGDNTYYMTDEAIQKIADVLLAHGVKCMPFIAMIEQTTENGKFCNNEREQKFNGRYCMVYEDKTKWQSPLIDICGRKAYNTEEANKAVEDRTAAEAALEGGVEE